jgi:phospholipid/cholesterol/gamma-HCH transport system substrate-binding protein
LEAKTNYTIVGIVVLILATALVSVALWLSVGFNKKSYDYYTLYMHEAAAGLSEESAVKYNGVQVGFVKKIKLNKNDPRQVEILLSIESGTPITISTTATLISQGITGVSYVGLSADSADLEPLQKMPGEPYPVIPTKPSLFNQLDTILKEVSENVNKVSTQISHVFNEDNAHYLTETLKHLDKITGVVSDDSKYLHNSMRHANIFLKNMAILSKDFPEIIKELKNGVTQFKAMSIDMRKAGNNVSGTMIAGKNTLDKISQETLPPAITLLRRLNAISANIEAVSNQMRQNPSVVIRGTKPLKPGPGE